MGRKQGFARMTRTEGVCDFCGRDREVYRFSSHDFNADGKPIELCRDCIEEDMPWEVDRADERAEGGDDAVR